MKNLPLLLGLICLLLAAAHPLAAQESELLKAAQNPLADLISLPFQNNTNFGLGPYDRTQNVLNIQPVIPIAKGRIITRTIIPILTQPSFTDEGGSTTGLSDIQFTAFYTPSSGGLMWGAGPVLSLPTATNRVLGTGKWGIGPSAVVLAQPGPWTLGLLVNNVWSFAGQDNRAEVNSFLAQVFVVRNFPAFYINTAPIITANWKALEGERWTVPVGAGIGKLFRLGKLPVNAQVGYYHNVIRPTYGATGQLRVQLQILLPRAILGGGGS